MKSGKKKKKRENKPQHKILIFYEGEINSDEIKKVIDGVNFLTETLKLRIKAEEGGNIWDGVRSDIIKGICEKLVRIRITKWNKFVLHRFVSPAELSFEMRRATGEIKSWGIIYDGFALAGIFNELMIKGRGEKIKGAIPVIITDRQIATIGEDGRYHLRIAVLSFPAVISKHGFFSAPAKPKEYHLMKMVSEDLAIEKGYHLREKIERLFPILSRAYVILSYLWYVHGVGFCGVRECLFSDPHTTDDLLMSKRGKIHICPEHKSLIKRILNEKF